MPNQATIYLKRSGTIAAGEDGLVHVDPVGGLPPIVMPRKVAISAARALLLAVAALEDRPAALPAELHGSKDAGAGQS